MLIRKNISPPEERIQYRTIALRLYTGKPLGERHISVGDRFVLMKAVTDPVVSVQGIAYGNEIGLHELYGYRRPLGILGQ